MKKLISLVFAVLFLAGNAFAAIFPLDAEVAVKAGLDWGRIKVEQEKIDRNDLKNSSVGISVGGEVLYPFNLIDRKFKLGAGLQYLAPRHVSYLANSPDFSWMPIYATLHGYPLLGADVYLKLNYGYAMSYVSDFNLEEREGKTDWTGKYVGFGAGYDISDDLFVEVIYDRFFTETSFTRVYPRNNITVRDYIRVSINAGYKFKI
jgi:hypothetical protein